MLSYKLKIANENDMKCPLSSYYVVRKFSLSCLAVSEQKTIEVHCIILSQKKLNIGEIETWSKLPPADLKSRQRKGSLRAAMTDR